MDLKKQLPILILLFLVTNSLSGCTGLPEYHQQQQRRTSQLMADMERIRLCLDEHSQSLIRVEEGINRLEKSVDAVDKKTTTAIQTTLSEAKKIKAIKAKALKGTKTVKGIKRAKGIKEVKGLKTKQAVPPTARRQYDKLIIGEEEWVFLPVANAYFRARIDSGAATSSISAKNLERFERDGKKWVRFDLEHKDTKHAVTLERPIERRVAIKQSTSDEKESRPVISLMVKLGELSETTEFTLADREQMSFPILLGRSFLRDVVLIDVSKQFLIPQYRPAEHSSDAEAPTGTSGKKTN